MSPVLTFFIGLGLLVLFGWYFATDVGLRKRLLATTLVMLLVAFSIATIWPPKDKIQLGLDIQGGTSFLIRLMGGDKEVSQGMLGQSELDVTFDKLPARALAVDIIYIPLETPFLRAARKRGNPTINGLGMLLHQGRPAWRAWFGIEPEVTAELRAMIEKTIPAIPGARP